MFRTISEHGLQFIKGWEALRLYAYPDPRSDLAMQSQSVRRRWGMEPASAILADLPEPVRLLSGAPWTIGYGHTGDVKPDDHITEHQAEELLRFDLSPIEVGVNNVGIPLTQNQFDALCSACFNLGTGILQTHRSLGMALRGVESTPGDALLLYDHAGGHRDPGLTRRRKAEKRLYETPDEENGNA